MSEHIHEKVVTSAVIPARSLTLTSSNNIVVNHWHNSLELIYISEGHMDVGVNDKMYSLHAGDLLIVNSANLHYTQVYDLTTVNYTLQIPYSLLKTHIPDYDFLHFQLHKIMNNLNLLQIKMNQQKLFKNLKKHLVI